MQEHATALIDPNQVELAFKDCLFHNEEIPQDGTLPSNAVLVEGVAHKFALHDARLEIKRQQVVKWLNLLPHQFHKSGGGGWSFLNACIQDDGKQWTGLQLIAELLLCMGVGLGLVKCQVPRELWQSLPGSVPYYVIDTETEDNNAH